MEQGMTDAKTLINQRDRSYEDQTTTIFKHVTTTLDGIRDYIIVADPSYTPGIFNWEEVGIFDDLLMLVGIVRYDPGAKFVLDGEMIEITEDNKEYFNRVLRIGIPLSIVNQYDSTATYDFLHQLHHAVQEEQEHEAIATIPPRQIKVNEYEFDLEELTDDQRRALEFSGKVGKIN